MNIKEWKRETNKGLKNKGYAYRVRNNLIYQFLVFWFIVTSTLIFLSLILFSKFLFPYVELILDNKDAVLNYLNETVIGL